MNRLRGIGAVSLLAAAALLFGITGCGGGGGSGDGGTIIRGTTDQPVGIDPAGVYDLPSWDILVNVYQTLRHDPARRQQAGARRGEVVRLHQPDHLQVHDE